MKITNKILLFASASPLMLTACGGAKPFSKEAKYLNECDAYLCTYNDDRDLFALLENKDNVTDITSINSSHTYTCVSIDANKHANEMTKEIVDGLYSLLKSEKYVWISFYGATDFSFLNDTGFDNGKHYFDPRPAVLFSWYNDGKPDYVNVTGYSSHPNEYTDSFYRQTMYSFYTNAVKAIEGSK